MPLVLGLAGANTQARFSSCGPFLPFLPPPAVVLQLFRETIDLNTENATYNICLQQHFHPADLGDILKKRFRYIDLRGNIVTVDGPDGTLFEKTAGRLLL